MILMFVDFQADANPVQVLWTPLEWGTQCLTHNVAHISEDLYKAEGWLVIDMTEEEAAVNTTSKSRWLHR